MAAAQAVSSQVRSPLASQGQGGAPASKADGSRPLGPTSFVLLGTQSPRDKCPVNCPKSRESLRSYILHVPGAREKMQPVLLSF